MDTTKQNPLAQAQESDDLIAELARLVAKDARTQSVNSAVYSQPEPEPQANHEPHPAHPTVYQESWVDEPTIREPVEPVLAQADRRAAPEPVFDFGFIERPSAERNDHEVEPAPQEHDPIAELIASVEQDNFTQDEQVEEDDLLVADPVRSDFADFGYEVTPAPEPNFSEFVEPVASPAEQREPQAHAQPSNGLDDRDPLSEIEALIGEAARMSVSAGNEGRKVRSSFLDTNDYQDIKADRAVDAAESAILAAAAASGAQLSRVKPLEDPRLEPELVTEFDEELYQPQASVDEPELADHAFEQEEAQVARTRRRPGIIVPAVAGAVIVALLAGGYFLFLAPSPVPSEAPVLTANAGDIKEIPENTSTPTTASESVIFNEIDGNTVPPESEALVSRDQTNGATGADVGSVIGAEEGEIVLANRPVRTVTVRPDGTIVSGNDSIAGSNILPVERPDVPAVPNSSLTSDPIGEAIAAAIADESVSTLAPTSTVATTQTSPVATTPAQTSAPETQVPAATATTVVDPANIPRPIPRPSGLSAPQSAPVAQVATTPIQPPAATPAPVQTPVATPGNVGAWVQLSSQRSEEAARSGIPSLQSRYGALFNGAELDVSRVDLGDRGVYYRVRLPQPTMADANAVCNAIKGQGGDCFVLNN